MREEIAASHRGGEQSRDLHQVRFGSLIGAVPQDHVGYLVAEHACYLRFVVGGKDQSRVDKGRAAGQREGVYGFVVDQREGELKSGIAHVRCGGQPLADLADIVLQFRV